MIKKKKGLGHIQRKKEQKITQNLHPPFVRSWLSFFLSQREVRDVRNLVLRPFFHRDTLSLLLLLSLTLALSTIAFLSCIRTKRKMR